MNAPTAKAIKEIVELLAEGLEKSYEREELERLLHEFAEGIKLDTLEN